MKGLTKGLIVVGVVIILIIALFLVIDNKKESFDETKAVDLGITGTISYLDNCLTVKDIPLANRSEDMRGCPDSEGMNINETAFNKLRLLQNLKGSSVNVSLSNCNMIYTFNYQKVVAKLSYYTINVYSCDDKQYIGFLKNPPSGEDSTRIFQIKLNESLTNQLTA